jgi:signal peptidase I
MDFSLILFIAVVVTGSVWLWDRLLGSRQRRAGAVTSTGQTASLGTDPEGDKSPVRKEPLVVEYAKAFFPVLLLVFALRSFIVEPFRIPSGSMLPTLHIGDFILVNKFTYGIRLPVVNTKIMGSGQPERGDIMVFRFPHDEKINFIKRVVGIPGDTVVYENKQLFINGEVVPQDHSREYRFEEAGKKRLQAVELSEQLGDITHDIIVETRNDPRRMQFQVPEGRYFVMGDNRDHSNDSRYWGFVPDENVVGRAFFIWFSWDAVNGGGVKWSRIGNLIN